MIKFLVTLQENKKSFYEALYGLLTALLFSYFIYAEHYGITIKFINTFFALSSLALFIYAPKRAILIAGFCIGILWFYWIGYSFEYQGVGYLLPFITLGFGFIYLAFFGILALSKKAYLRAILLFGLSFIEPFDWNWLQIELIFIESYIGIYKYQLALVLLFIISPHYLKGRWKYLAPFFLIFSFNFSSPEQKESTLKIKLIQTDISQEKKWLAEQRLPILKMIFAKINTAIEEEYEVIIFPETILPMYLNKNIATLNSFKYLSKDISIVIGTLLREDSKLYNVTYMFENGDYKIAKKMVLVPFGEYIPLPKFAQKIINDTFFSGQSDFIGAKEPTDFIIHGQKFRNAICYEATCQEIYEGDVDYVIATSNNAWFSPSIEPTIQNLLLRFYARKNGVTIYHSANYKGTGIIR